MNGTAKGFASMTALTLALAACGGSEEPVDRDHALDPAEWDQATRVLESFSDTTAAWVEFDADGSQGVELAEVHTRVEDEAVLGAIDANADGQVEDEEMNRWFFALFDTNQNGAVDRDEWRLAEIYLDVPTL